MVKRIKNQNGWTISLYSDVGQDNQRSEGYAFLSWSPYDRIKVHISNDFEHFIFPSDESEWCGVKQQLHLIPCYYLVSGANEEDNIEWQSDVQSEYLVNRLDPSGSIIENYYGLQCIITVRIACQLFEKTTIDNFGKVKSSILEEITRNVFQFGSDKGLCFDCVAFETLGSEDFAFLLFADKIEVFSELLELFRCQKVKSNITGGKPVNLFDDICSIVGFNKINYNYTPNIEAIVRINAKTNDVKDEVKKVIAEISSKKPKTFDILQGINVFEIHFNPNDLSLWHSKLGGSNAGILNGDSQYYKDNIISSRTFWLKQNNSSILQQDSYIIEIELPENKNKISASLSIEEKDSHQVKNHIFKFIFNEYNRIINSPRCIEWKNILLEQRSCIIAFDEYYYDTDEEKRRFAYGMQSVLTHINQACTPIYEVPYHNHFYSGSFNDILKMYYGIIYFIKNKGERINRKPENKSSPFTFGIRFDSVENIQTQSFSTANQDHRFIIFQLPYSALYDFERTALLLAHEVFHYIAPLDRKYRNKRILDVWKEYLLLKISAFDEYINNLPSKSHTENYYFDKCTKTIKFCKQLYTAFYKTVCNEYNDFNKYEIVVFANLEFVSDVSDLFFY